MYSLLSFMLPSLLCSDIVLTHLPDVLSSHLSSQELRPSDSRMLVALGESYEKLDKTQDAMKCFWKAHCVGDIEGGIALLRLARYNGLYWLFLALHPIW